MKSVYNKFSMDDARFMKSLKEATAKKGHRMDLHLASSRVVEDKQEVTVGYHPDAGLPTEQEIQAFVRVNYPQTSIDWSTYRNGNNCVSFSLISNVERIPVQDLKKVPPNFKSIGTGIYKDASNGSVWELQKQDDGFVLIRQQAEVPPASVTHLESFKQGDIVLTPFGKGQVLGHTASKIVVRIGPGQIREFTAAEVRKHYNVDQERKNLKDYYTKAYGDPAFAEALTKKM